MTATTPWRPVRPLSRRCEKNSSGLHDVQRSRRSTVAAGERELGRPPQVDVRPDHDLVAEAGAVRLAHLVADLVAARPDPGPDHRGDLAAERRDRVLDHAAQQAAPAGVDDRDPPSRSRSAIGRQSAVKAAMGTPGSSVQSASPCTPREPAAARFTVVPCTW